MKLAAVIRISLTVLMVGLAALLARSLWTHYMYSPWTRDGRVRADVVRIAPDVTGLVTQVDVADNQAVKQGDVLFVIDPDRYRLAVAQAEAGVAAARSQQLAARANVRASVAAESQSKSNYDMRAAQAKRRENLSEVLSTEDRANAQAEADGARAAWEHAQAAHEQAEAAQAQAQAAFEQAQAALATAQLNLQRIQVRAPVDGYVTNLLVRAGDYASAGAARMALIDQHSYWVYGYFEETKLPYLQVGDPVDVRLMSGGARLQGRVESIAHGITDASNPTGSDLLSDVNPTFNWVRLAQRVPVRIHIDADHLPAGTVLAAGMTATLIVHPHSSAPQTVAAR